MPPTKTFEEKCTEEKILRSAAEKDFKHLEENCAAAAAVDGVVDAATAAVVVVVVDVVAVTQQQPVSPADLWLRLVVDADVDADVERFGTYSTNPNAIR